MWVAGFIVLAVLTSAFAQQSPKMLEEDPFVRDIEFWRQRAFPFDRTPEGAYERAIAHAERLAQRKSIAATLAAQPQWRLIGPDNIGGRTRTVVHHPTQPGVVYVGAAGGGIWRTTDHGQSWEPLFDNGVSLSMGALAIDPNNPDVLYAGTGEIQPASNMQDAWGTGMYKSTDGGRTWRRIGLSTVGAFSKVYVHPRNSNLVYAGAVRSAPGLYKSTDAGASWQRMNRFAVSDVTIDPQNENVLWIGVWSNGVYKSTDGGRTFVRSSSGLPNPEELGRISVQCAPSNTSILYALVEGPDPTGQVTGNVIGAIYKSTDGGSMWTKVFQGDASFFNGQGSYNNFIAVHPTSPDIAFAGGIDCWRTSNGGRTWQNVTQGYSGGNVHVDQHALAFNPLDPNEIYLANDGGMYRTTTGGGSPSAWQPINNGYAVTQFYAMDIDRNAELKTYGGTQDNGTLGSVRQQTSWQMIYGGDGFYTVVNPINPSIVYGEVYYGGLWWRNVTTGQGGSFTNGIDPADQGAWSAPLVLDRASGTLYHGRGKLYSTYLGGGTWSPRVAAPFDPQAKISAIGPSPLDENLLYIGLENGRVLRTTDGGETWENVSLNGLPLRFVRDIVCSWQEPATAWVCFSGYGSGHVFKTTDAGRSWQDISTTLPDAPVNALDLHPQNENVIIVGTDAGVFITFNGGQSWTPLGRGLPRSPVLDLQIYPERNVVRVATHGRSMWECDLPVESITEPEITSPLGGEVVMATSSMVFSWHGFNEPVKLEITYTDGEYWTTLATGVVGGAFWWTVENRPSERVRIRVTEVGNPLVSVISNPFSILEFQRGSVQKATSISFVAYGLAYDGKGGLWATSFYTPHLYKLNATTLQIEKAIELGAGDTLCTDLTIDRQSGLVYIHRLTSTATSAGARIVVVDTNGTILRRLTSPASSYGIGIELVGDKLILTERDGMQRILVCNRETFQVEQTYSNPFREFYGPRCIAYDGNQYLYHVGTQFTAGGGGLQAAYVLRLRAEIPSQEHDRMELISSSGGTINARGIEIDIRDGNYWVSDLAGNIYKIASFDTPSNPLSNVTNPSIHQQVYMLVMPNPAAQWAVVRVVGRPAAQVRLALYDVHGERLMQSIQQLDLSGQGSVPVDCSQLPSGMYTLVLMCDGSVVATGRLVVTR